MGYVLTGRERNGTLTQTWKIEATYAQYHSKLHYDAYGYPYSGRISWMPRFSTITDSSYLIESFQPQVIQIISHPDTGTSELVVGANVVFKGDHRAYQWEVARFPWKGNKAVYYPQFGLEDTLGYDELQFYSWEATVSIRITGGAYEVLTCSSPTAPPNDISRIIYSEITKSGYGSQTTTAGPNVLNSASEGLPLSGTDLAATALCSNRVPPQWQGTDDPRVNQYRADLQAHGLGFSSCSAHLDLSTDIPGWGAPDTVTATAGPATATPSLLIVSSPGNGQEHTGSARAFGSPITTLNTYANLIRWDAPETTPQKVTFQRGGETYRYFVQKTGTGTIVDTIQAGGSSVNVGGIFKDDGGTFTTYNDQQHSQLSATGGLPTRVFLGDGPLDPNQTYQPGDVIDHTTDGLPSDFYGQHGHRGGGLTLSQAPYTDYEGGSKAWLVDGSQNSWKGTNATVTTAGGALIITPTGTNPSASRLLPDTRNVGYRYVTVRFRSRASGNQPLRFGVAPAMTGDTPSGMWWQLTTGAADEWKEVELDLFADRPQASSTGTYYRNPLFSGGFSATGWTFWGLAAGITYEVQWFRGTRRAVPTLCVWQREGLTPPLPHIGAWVDGFQGLTVYRTQFTPSLADIVAKVNNTTQALTGWTATAPAPVAATSITAPGPTPTYPLAALGDSTSAAQTIGGGGHYKGGGTALDVPVGTVASQPTATIVYPQVPGLGDPQSGGAYSLTTNIYYDVVVGERVEGVVVPASGSVEIKVDNDNSSGGTGMVADTGRYYTGAPYVRTAGDGLPQYSVKPTAVVRYRGGPADPNPFHIDADAPRKHARRQYVRWHITTRRARGVDSLSHPHYGYYARVEGEEASDSEPARVRLYQTRAGMPDNLTKFKPVVTVAEGTGDDAPSAPTITRDYSDRLRVRFVKGDAGVWECVSDSEGETWGTPAMAIAGAVEPRFGQGVAGHLAKTYCFAIAPDADPATTGTLKMQIVAAGSAAGGGSAITCQEYVGGSLVPLVIERGGFAVVQGYEGPARWSLAARAKDADGYSEWLSSDECATWRKVT